MIDEMKSGPVVKVFMPCPKEHGNEFDDCPECFGSHKIIVETELCPGERFGVADFVMREEMADASHDVDMRPGERCWLCGKNADEEGNHICLALLAYLRLKREKKLKLDEPDKFNNLIQMKVEKLSENNLKDLAIRMLDCSTCVEDMRYYLTRILTGTLPMDGAYE